MSVGGETIVDEKRLDERKFINQRETHTMVIRDERKKLEQEASTKILSQRKDEDDESTSDQAAGCIEDKIEQKQLERRQIDREDIDRNLAEHQVIEINQQA